MQKTHHAKKSLGLKKFSEENFSPEHKHIRAKKALGQNFLKSEQALKKIIEEGEIIPSDIILEIGPGKGALTKKLLSAQNASHNKADKEKTGWVIAIEKDKNLIEFLQEKFSQEISDKKLILINEDILDIDPALAIFNFCSGPRFSSPKLSPSEIEARPDHSQKLKLQKQCTYKIIANIPYNITGAILKKFLTENNQPSMMVLMVQNEVAKRIVGLPRHGGVSKKESILSISVKAYGIPKLAMKVPARYFSPAPKVDSAIISIKNISRKFFEENKINENNFWELIHTGFAHKRKKLSSNFKKIKENLNKEIFEQVKNKRAEDLTLIDWLNLIKMD